MPHSPAVGPSESPATAAEHADAFTLQSRQCQALGSPMYAELFAELAAQCTEDSSLAQILAGSIRPIHNAVPLRLAGTVHRAVLRGDAPHDLACNYPTAGGSPTKKLATEFMNYCIANDREIGDGLRQQVQTNEVRRSSVLRESARWMRSIGIAEFDLFEIGASAGLNLLFDCYPDEWFPSPALHNIQPAVVRSRRGCDPFPVDLVRDNSVLRLRSFVWPDQTQRHERLQAAIAIARQEKVTVEQSLAASWVESVLEETVVGPRVLFHSIVWQYLGVDEQNRVRDAIAKAGKSTTDDNPLVWLRMEPNGPMADVRATVWKNGSLLSDITLADVGYHGEPLQWKTTAY